MRKLPIECGQRFGKLEIVEEVPFKPGTRMFLCKCDCGNVVKVSLSNLRSGHTTSCGCYKKECSKKFNTYTFYDTYAIGLTFKGDSFIIDLDEYERVKDHCWYKYGGYITTTIQGKKTSLHRFIMCPPDGMVVDHINHNGVDNRKCNLRVCSYQENRRNSVAKGVYFSKPMGKWYAQIGVNYKNINLGYFDTWEEAFNARKQAETEYFKEFSYKGGVSHS